MWPFQRSRKKRYITACELSVTRLPHLSGIGFIDGHEILVASFPLRWNAKPLVQKKSRALYIWQLISMVPETAVLWSYGIEFSPIVRQAGLNSRYFSRVGKKVIKSYGWKIIFRILTTLSSRNVGEISAVWYVLIFLFGEISRIFVTRNIVIINHCE